MCVPSAFWITLRTAAPPLLESGGAPPTTEQTREGQRLVETLQHPRNGPPCGNIATLVRQANGSGRPILALDLPSGLHPDTGEIFDPCIQAHATLTLALPKRGLLVPRAKPYVGRLWVGDIGVPPALYERIGVHVDPLFSRAHVIQVEEP